MSQEADRTLRPQVLDGSSSQDSLTYHALQLLRGVLLGSVIVVVGLGIFAYGLKSSWGQRETSNAKSTSGPVKASAPIGRVDYGEPNVGLRTETAVQISPIPEEPLPTLPSSGETTRSNPAQVKRLVRVQEEQALGTITSSKAGDAAGDGAVPLSSHLVVKTAASSAVRSSASPQPSPSGAPLRENSPSLPKAVLAVEGDERSLLHEFL